MGFEVIFALAFIAFFVLVAALGIFMFVFWILMIVDCAQRKFKTEGEKIVWILIIILASWVGALIYYFVVKKNGR